MTQYEQTAKLMKQMTGGKGGLKMPKGFGKMMSKMGGGMDMSALEGMSGMGMGGMRMPKENNGPVGGRKDRKKKKKGRR